MIQFEPLTVSYSY